MDDVNNLFQSIAKILKVVSCGLEAMAEKAASFKEEKEKPLVNVVPENKTQEKSLEEKSGEIKFLVTEDKNKIKKKVKGNTFVFPAVKKKVPKEKPFKDSAAKEKPSKSSSKKIKKEVIKTSLRGKVLYKKETGNTLTDTILEIFNNSNEPLSAELLAKKTGFALRPVKDVIYRQIKMGKIKKSGDKLYNKV
ncbi:MAG: hypothetical protein HQK79_21765 [Desulfobacterales bacterium]|nr:hypothetical protein [Desulfobacterales bacterium]MBF0397683.1 hypothetical protein [Desulfobacterales bacterium]